jgi:hypothetical protein
MPGIAHSYYFQFPDDSSPESVTTFIRDGMDLAATEWLQESPGPTQAPDVGPAPFPAPPPPIGVAGGDDAVPDTPRLTVGDTTMEPVDEDDSGRRSTTGSGPGSP